MPSSTRGQFLRHHRLVAGRPPLLLRSSRWLARQVSAVQGSRIGGFTTVHLCPHNGGGADGGERKEQIACACGRGLYNLPAPLNCGCSNECAGRTARDWSSTP